MKKLIKPSMFAFLLISLILGACTPSRSPEPMQLPTSTFESTPAFVEPTAMPTIIFTATTVPPTPTPKPTVIPTETSIPNFRISAKGQAEPI